jgi:quercetin 2,3-dioxygenase
MNTEAEIQEAFADYRRTGFGGWPWPSDDPDHGPEAGRFARHADGRVERVEDAVAG